MSEHTPKEPSIKSMYVREPWTLGELATYSCGDVEASRGRCLRSKYCTAAFIPVAGLTLDSHQEVCERIVACVNACAGISTANLTLAAVERLRVDNRIPWVISELRRSAKEGFNFSPVELGTLADVLQAAIAAVTGGNDGQ